MDLNNSVVVITGAATGVGRALAYEAARRGARIVAADINDATETVEHIRATGGEAITSICDVTDPVAVQKLVETTLQNYGQVNAICANAGTSFGGGTIENVTLADIRRVFELNVFGVLNVVQAFLPAIKQSASNGQSAIILITGSEHSLAIPTTSPPLISYTTSKHALIGFVGCVRRDLVDTGVQISLLCPGWVRTESLQKMAAQNAQLAHVMSHYAQDLNEVARLAFEGVNAGALFIPTNPASRDYSLAAHQEILEAVAALPMVNSSSQE